MIRLQKNWALTVAMFIKWPASFVKGLSKKNKIILHDEVEFDEVYVVAGHKGNPEAVAQKGREGRRNRLKGARGRGALEKEKPPIWGMIQRCGDVVIQMLANVQQKTIEPLIKATVLPGTLIYTDEYGIYNRLNDWGYEHESVNHGKGEYARDDDGMDFMKSM